MTKIIAAVITGLLCAPAVAAPATKSYAFQLSVRGDGQAARNYKIDVTETSCGSVVARNAAVEDHVNVCTEEQPNQRLKVRVEWSYKVDKQQINMTSMFLVDRGAKFELDGGIAKLAVALN